MRDTALTATISFAVIIVLGSELMSWAGLIRFWPVLTLWLSAAGLAGLAGWRASRPAQGGSSAELPSRAVPPLFALIGGLLGVTLLAGILSTPGSYDAMVYHVPRQVRWIQQASLDHLPTHILRQLYREPFAEMLSAEAFLLTGNDRAAALLQWAALVGSLIAVSLISRDLGANRNGQVFSSFLVVTIPIVFLQASSSKNDLITALWYVAVVWLILRISQARQCSAGRALLLGAAFGLMTLTKAAGYILGFPLAVWVGITIVGAQKRRAWKCLVLIAVPVFLLNAGHWSRNWALFGTLTSPAAEPEPIFNTSLTPGGFVCRALREATLQMGTPLSGVNAGIEQAVVTACQGLGVDVNEPGTTYPGRRFAVHYEPANESEAPAPLHLLLFGIALGCSPWLVPSSANRDARVLLLMILFGFLLLCLFLRWEPTLGRRLHIPLLMLSSAYVASVLAQGRRQLLLPVLVVLLLLSLVTPSRWNPRSLWGGSLGFRPPEEQLFGPMKELKEPFLATAQLVRSREPDVVGLLSRGAHGYEYPMMFLLRRGLYEPHFEAFDVGNLSRGNRRRPYRRPDVVVSFSPLDEAVDPETGDRYQAVGHFGPLSVLEPASKEGESGHQEGKNRNSLLGTGSL